MNAVKIEPLFRADQIMKRVEAIADLIAAEGGGPYLVEIILNGAVMFGADLTRALSRRGVAIEMDFIALSSYGRDMESSGTVELAAEARGAIKDRTVLIIDDILETGRTLEFARDYFLDRGAAHVLICVLLDKSLGKEVRVKPDFTGFACPDEFVVGYGMDHAYRYRELPFIGRMTGENK